MRVMPASASTWHTGAASLAVMPRRIAMRWRCLACMVLPVADLLADLLPRGQQSGKACRKTIDDERLLADFRQCLGVKLNETGPPDDGKIAPGDPLALRADLSADEEARQIARAPIGRARRQQGAGAHLKQHGRQPLGCVDPRDQPAIEALGVVGGVVGSAVGSAT